jgi:hypothetical protein
MRVPSAIGLQPWHLRTAHPATCNLKEKLSKWNIVFYLHLTFRNYILQRTVSQVVLYCNADSIVRTPQECDVWARYYSSASIKSLYLELVNHHRVHSSCQVAPPLVFSWTRSNCRWADVILLLWFLMYCLYYDRACHLLLLVSFLAYSLTLNMRQYVYIAAKCLTLSALHKVTS